jgi:hypothetical protein
MGLFSSENQDTFRDVLKAFSTAAGKNYPDSHGGHGYAYQAGYFESMCNEMFGYLPKKLQKRFIEDMVRAAQKQERQVIESMNKETV